MCTVCGLGISVCSAARDVEMAATAMTNAAHAGTRGARSRCELRSGSIGIPGLRVGRTKAMMIRKAYGGQRGCNDRMCAKMGVDVLKALSPSPPAGRLPLHAERGAGGEDQRLDHDRNGARVRQHGADVDIVELLELEPVDRDDRILDLHLLAQMDPDQPAQVAVAGQNQRMAVRQSWIGQTCPPLAARCGVGIVLVVDSSSPT